jgi:MFS family permease
MLIVSQLVFGLTGLLVPLAILVPKVAIAMLVASEFGQWMAVIVYYINAVSVRQAITPDRLQGRVNATIRFLGGGALPIGALAGGALGTTLGLRPALFVCAVGALLSPLPAVCSPLRQLREQPVPDPLSS